LNTLRANLIDIENRSIHPVEIGIADGKITHVLRIDETQKTYILPGFIDAHIHIESSMVVPAAFAKTAVKHGSIATVSDPHEIANVMGVEGVRYMIESAAKVPFHFFFGAPSCVPATEFETAGDRITSTDIEELMSWPDIWYLAEVMNYPAVIARDEEMMAKIQAAHRAGKRVDGHCPNLRGEQLSAYLSAGISTDHESFTYEEGKEKLEKGMLLMIREGSAARNFRELIPLIREFPRQIMFCSDDKHPDDLEQGHLNSLVKRALSEGYDLFDVLHAACVLPVKHYSLPTGLLKPGDSADFIEIDHPDQFNILATYISGQCVFDGHLSYIQVPQARVINRFDCAEITPSQLTCEAAGKVKLNVMQALNRQLITGKLQHELLITRNGITPDVERDILKIVVVNRYFDAPPAVAFIHGFGLKSGAIASSVAHDSHNIVAVGTNDVDLAAAINQVIREKGGISYADGGEQDVMPLPVAGIMSTLSVEEASAAYSGLHQKAKALGCLLDAPYMTLSFMALLVIPALKISDRGLFDAEKFCFVPVVE
jgi:adenine deaminase